jgi:hypothetical protein
MPREVVCNILASMPLKTQVQGAATLLVAAFDPTLKGKPIQIVGYSTVLMKGLS